MSELVDRLQQRIESARAEVDEFLGEVAELGEDLRVRVESRLNDIITLLERISQEITESEEAGSAEEEVETPVEEVDDPSAA